MTVVIFLKIKHLLTIFYLILSQPSKNKTHSVVLINSNFEYNGSDDLLALRWKLGYPRHYAQQLNPADIQLVLGRSNYLP